MVGGDSFGSLLDLCCDGAMVLLKVLGMLQDAVEVFLPTKQYKKLRVISRYHVFKDIFSCNDLLSLVFLLRNFKTVFFHRVPGVSDDVCALVLSSAASQAFQ